LLDRQSHDFNIGNLQPLHRFTSRTILGPRGSGIQFYYAALLMTPRLTSRAGEEELPIDDCRLTIASGAQ
ncbi:MAG TPA: hypothetical protein VKM93_02535, partial [Terriglobia bacterium]|nr:hypothetical protein [Terriglobia bacterium]